MLESMFGRCVVQLNGMHRDVKKLKEICQSLIDPLATGTTG